MKLLLALIFFLSFNIILCQAQISENHKVESLIHIWGLLKYHHPEVSAGKFNFDEEFIKEFSKIQPIKTHDELNREFVNWIKQFDNPKTKYDLSNPLSDNKELFSKNADFTWIETSDLSPELIQVLYKIKNNTSYGKFYAKVEGLTSFISFENDKAYLVFDAKKKAHRVLFLASFWNKMRYWNVNIYLTKTLWKDVLTDLVPEFLSEDIIKYELAKDKLFASLNDSHTTYRHSYFYKDTSHKSSIYGGKVINDTLLIKTIFNQDIAKKEGIELGDMIVKINNKSITGYINEQFSNRISASNIGYLKRILEPYSLLSARAEKLDLEVVKKDKTQKKISTKLYKYKEYKFDVIRLEEVKKSKWKLYDKENIGYINLDSINKQELKTAFKAFQNTKGLIIDLRNYPRNLRVSDVPSFLYPEKQQFIKVLAPYAPSYAKYNIKTALRIIENPFTAGKNNKNYY